MKRMGKSGKKYVNYFSNDGFTLIEALAALSVFLVISFFMAPVFHIIMNNNDYIQQNEQMEWDLFCSQMKKEIRMSSKVNVLNNTLYMTIGTDTVIYDKSGSTVRRRVNYTGNEIMLQNVRDVSFLPLKNAIKAQVTDVMGREHEVTAYSLIEWI